MRSLRLVGRSPRSWPRSSASRCWLPTACAGRRRAAGQAETWVRSTAPLLNAALAAPLARGDYATIQKVLQRDARRARAELSGGAGPQRFCRSGFRARRQRMPLPQAETPRSTKPGAIRSLRRAHPRYARWARLRCARCWHLHGVPAAGRRSELLTPEPDAGRIGITISLLILTCWPSGSRATLRSLTEAGAAIAAASFRRRVPVTSEDEVGELAAAFNTMAAADRGQDPRAGARRSAHLRDAARTGKGQRDTARISGPGER